PAAEVPAANAAPADEIVQPRGLAVLANGEVLVADFGNHRIQRRARDGAVLSQWGSHGDGLGQFKEPTGIAVSANGRIAVADTWNGRVQFFTPGGQPDGQSAVAMYGPRGVAFGPDGSVYVADTGNSRVVKLTPEGKLAAAIGGPGQGPGQFAGPIGIAVDGQGLVYVADNGNGRLQILDPTHQPSAAIAIEGWSNAVYSEPYVTVDRAGRIWVSVPLARQLRAYDRQGKLLRTVDPAEARPVPFDTPTGLGFDRVSDEIVIADLAGRVVRCQASVAAP
ncbi:MAG TPA: NHL repeat-containing protein, partial [Terriglobales bacterium]|nr:NHL repeat-containing protein [Terriglobales bacterium]